MSTRLKRRDLVRALVVAPPLLWLPPGLLLAGCGRPRTPLAHLYGKEWVYGAYEHYGSRYVEIQRDAEQRSFEAYGLLAQKGVDALEMLQQREVPFHLRVTEGDAAFSVERDLPDRLTFTAGMSAADRKRATLYWKKARKHIVRDYQDIDRLNWALTRLLQQLQRIRLAVDEGVEEQFRLAFQSAALSEGDLPFELPYQVGPKDYDRVLILLVERLDDDRRRLEATETAILSVGLLARSTDARSASLAINLRKVLYAVVKDAESSSPRPARFPTGETLKGYVKRGRQRMDEIRQSEDYKTWLSRNHKTALEKIGSLLVVLDMVTGIPVSKVYGRVINVFAGDADYLDYLKLLASLSPSPELGAVLGRGIELTEKVRDGYRKGRAIYDKTRAAINDPSAMIQASFGALVNTGTDHARAQIGKQLVLIESASERDGITKQLASTGLMRDAVIHLARP